MLAWDIGTAPSGGWQALGGGTNLGGLQENPDKREVGAEMRAARFGSGRPSGVQSGAKGRVPPPGILSQGVP